jgi:uncharacterized XkdX family phage protein
MDWFTIVKRHYDAGRYTPEQVAVFVEAGKITPEQYEQITGEPYEPAE